MYGLISVRLKGESPGSSAQARVPVKASSKVLHSGFRLLKGLTGAVKELELNFHSNYDGSPNITQIKFLNNNPVHDLSAISGDILYKDAGRVLEDGRPPTKYDARCSINYKI